MITEKKLSTNNFNIVYRQVLNRYEKEQLVIQLYQEGKIELEVALIAHKSFSDIKK